MSFEDSTKILADNITQIFDDYYYIVFVLGTDLLKNKLNFNDGVDSCYDYCKQAAKVFLNSKYNINTKSMYSCLEEFVQANIK